MLGLRLCVDCKHFVDGNCHRNASVIINPVTGNETILNKLNASEEREPFGFFICGLKAKYFELKPIKRDSGA